MPTTAEGAAGRRLALVVATGTYADPTLAKLRAPGRDASDLAAVLEDAAVGGFEVETVLDAPAESLRRRIAQFCAQNGPGDLALVYLSCHGVLDDRGRLYYATADTDRALLSATAVSSAWLNEQLEDCRCRRQILVLDCCHSGAFAKGAKGEGGLALRERFEGRGRVVLTGSRGTEYSFEHDRVVGDSVSSVFTRALVEGLRSGDADRDGDGVITVSELYDYAYEAVRARESRQTPTLWTYGAEGDLLVAHSPRGAIVKAAPLPEDLIMLLESARPRVRESAVAELADLLRGPDAGRALTARAELERIVAEDAPSVAGAARAALDAAPATGRPDPPRAAPPTPASPPPTPTPPPPPPTEGPPDPSSLHRRRRTVAIAAAAIVVAIAAVAVALLAGAGGRSSGPGVFPVGGSPRGVAVDRGTAWVASFETDKVTRIESSETKPIPVRPHPGKIAAGEGSVWVSVNNGRGLDRIDPDAGEVTEESSVNVKDPVTELAIAKGMLWVGSAEAHTIRTFDLETGKPLEGVYRPGKGFEGVFAVGDDAVWAIGTEEHGSHVSRVFRINPPAEKGDPTPLGTTSYFAAVAYGQGTVWIADSMEGQNTVNAFDPDSAKVVDEVEVNTDKTSITGDDLAVAGDAVLVWDSDAGFLTRIDAGEMTAEEPPQEIRPFEVNESDNHKWSDLAVDGDFAWVTDPVSGTVHKVEY
jgi:DNA-binding beta-propeller fold protein YncE